MTKLRRIVSGGQTGVDQAALRAAKASGLTIGGWCPPGRVCESGIIPAEFSLQETPREQSPEALDVARSQRTEWNVRDSDATLVLRAMGRSDPGTDWAVGCAIRYGRSHFECDPTDPEAIRKIAEWLEHLEAQTLNVAGPSESSVPGIGEQVFTLLIQVFGRMSKC